MSVRKWATYILIIGVVTLALYIITVFIYGPIHIKGTLGTKYHQLENSSDKIIETDFLKLRAPSDWIHIFSGYGVEGDPYGSFQTKNGVIHYEYGMFAPIYEKDNEVYGYKVRKEQVGKYEVNIATNQENEMGIAVPAQHEMKRSLTFYMDDAVTDNYQAIIKIIEEIEYK